MRKTASNGLCRREVKPASLGCNSIKTKRSSQWINDQEPHVSSRVAAAEELGIPKLPASRVPQYWRRSPRSAND
jgi:hypothetical protein